MNNVSQTKNIPEGSIITHGFEHISYADTFRVAYPLGETIDQIVTDIFTTPDWVSRLMRLRNIFVRPLGLQTGNGVAVKSAPHYPIGSRAMYFTVCARTENEIIMEEDDTHLAFRCSVFINNDESAVYLTTLVHYNNCLGNAYFFVVKPFHKVIMKTLLNNALCLRQARISAAGNPL